MGSDQSHEANHPLSHHHLRRPNTDMDIHNPFSGLKKRIKHRLGRSERNPDGIGADTGGERVDSTTSLPQPVEPYVVAGESHDQVNTVGERDFSADRPQPDEPESAPTHGSENDQEPEISQNHPPLHSDSEIGVGSGSSREIKPLSPSVSTEPLSLDSGGPDSA